MKKLKIVAVALMPGGLTVLGILYLYRVLKRRIVKEEG